MPYSADLTALKHCYLCVFVMWDRRNEASYFQPYYRILPTTYENMPIFWDADELAHLEGSFMLRQLEDRKANIKADYDEICKHAPEFRQYSLRSEEHTSELQSLMRISYAVFCLKKKTMSINIYHQQN